MSINQAKEPLFIVGAPRSGTTLLTSFLASHPNIISGAETQFFNKIGIGTKSLNEALKDKNWPTAAIALMEKRLTLSGQSVLDLYGKTPDYLMTYLSARPPSIKAMLESIVIPESFDPAQIRWLEKTPNHLNHLTELGESFPNAKVILIHRDFRDSASSIPKLPWATDSIVENAALITSWFDNLDSRQDDILFVKYEDLVLDCKGTLERVFEFIGEDFFDEILMRSNAADVTTKGEPWKKDVHREIDTSNLSKWKSSMPTDVLKQVEAITHQILKRYSYDVSFEDNFNKLKILKPRLLDMRGLDEYAHVLNSRQFSLSYTEGEQSVIYVNETSVIKTVGAIYGIVKATLFDKKKIYLLGKKSKLLALFAEYL
ncbi:hypothetical protein KUL152_13150 [Tenacibaculum sp. KUL152]|nr:hypothetical protein KUL152_13150 [Tenacibaculum sp. KUL152]